MITKILELKDFAVFKDFEWDKSVLNTDQNKEKTKKEGQKNKRPKFQEINILYGRNYSGKTTLSKIFRAIETGRELDHYENGTVKLELTDGTIIGKDRLTDIPYKVRVFNTDFVKENLSFDEGIKPFAVVLGSTNTFNEAKISELQEQLGNPDEGKETGLYKEEKDAVEDWTEANKDLIQDEKKIGRLS